LKQGFSNARDTRVVFFVFSFLGLLRPIFVSWVRRILVVLRLHLDVQRRWDIVEWLRWSWQLRKRIVSGRSAKISLREIARLSKRAGLRLLLSVFHGAPPQKSRL